MSVESVIPSNHIIPCPLLLLLPSIFPSISVVPSELALDIRWPKYWSFSFSFILPMNVQDLGLTSLISLQSKRLSKSLLQHHSSKAPVLHHSAFIMVQISHLYMTTGKTIALTRWTFVDKIMSLLFNTLSRFAIAFLPRSKHLLIS